MINLKRWKIFQKLDPVFLTDIKRAYMLGIDSRQNVLDGEDGGNGAPDNLPAWNASLMEMRNGDVYSVALNSKNLVLLGQIDFQSLLPLVAVKVDGLRGQDIQDVSSGRGHVEVLTTDGRIYQWGEAHVEDKRMILKPGFLSGFSGKIVTQIACGQCHTLALTQDGDVYSWGRNIYGQVGIGDYTDKPDPVKVSGSHGFDKKIVSIACGGWNSYALDAEGKVWSWGIDTDNALGYASKADQLFPQRISSLNSVKQIVAGNHYCLALTNGNELYFWGKHTSDSRNSATPKKVQVPNVIDIAATCGSCATAFRTTENKVYLWGFAYGNLMPKPVVTEFTSLTELFLSLDSPVMLKAMEMDLNNQPWMEKLKLTFDDKNTAGVLFTVDGRIITAHKDILKLRSDYFKRLFDNFKWTMSQFEEFTYAVSCTFLRYLYTDRIEPPPRTADNALELIDMAVKFEEKDLQRRCERLLEVLITEETACTVYPMDRMNCVEQRSQLVQRMKDLEQTHCLIDAFRFLYPSKIAMSHLGYQDHKPQARLDRFYVRANMGPKLSGCDILPGILRDIAFNFIVPNFNAVVKTTGYKNMSEELRSRLIQELADENVFVGLKRKFQD